MKIYLTVLCLIISIVPQAPASIPTVEGLFRNSSNHEPTGNFVYLSFMVEEKINEELLEKTKIEDERVSLDKELLKQIMPPRYYKIVLSTEEEGKVHLLQIEYADNTMAKTAIDRTLYIPNLLSKLDVEADIEKSLFYSFMVMFTLNKSEGVVNFLQNAGVGFSANKFIMNKEKVELLNRYKRYLLATKGNREMREELESPLKPKNLDEKNSVNQILKSNMYQKSGKVKLIRDQDNFYWKVDLDQATAKFSNDKHQIKNFKIVTKTGEIVINYGEYILFDGIHELPKTILFKDQLERLFQIRMLKLRYSNRTKKKLSEVANDYLKIEVELKKQKQAQFREKNSKENDSTEQISTDLFLF